MSFDNELKEFYQKLISKKHCEPSPLAQLQREFAAALNGPKPNSAPEFLKVETADRFAIYHFAVSTRIEESIEEDFATLKEMLPKFELNALIKEYLSKAPSQTWSLGEVSAPFYAFLASHPQLQSTPWIAEAARLDWLRNLSSLTALDPTPAQDWSRRGEEEWLTAQLKLTSTLQIFESECDLLSDTIVADNDSAANEMRTAVPDEVRHSSAHQDQAHRRTQLLIYRACGAVEQLRIEPWELELIYIIRRGGCLEDLAIYCSQAALPPEQVQVWIAQMLQKKIITEVIFK